MQGRIACLKAGIFKGNLAANLLRIKLVINFSSKTLNLIRNKFLNSFANVNLVRSTLQTIKTNKIGNKFQQQNIEFDS